MALRIPQLDKNPMRYPMHHKNAYMGGLKPIIPSPPTSEALSNNLYTKLQMLYRISREIYSPPIYSNQLDWLRTFTAAFDVMLRTDSLSTSEAPLFHVRDDSLPWWLACPFRSSSCPTKNNTIEDDEHNETRNMQSFDTGKSQGHPSPPRASKKPWQP